jgi:hypothetical protein
MRNSCEALARRFGQADVRGARLVFQRVIAAHHGRFADVQAAEQLAAEDPDVIVGTWATCGAGGDRDRFTG